MKISLNEIKKYVKIPTRITNPELLELIGSRLVEIEEVIDLAPKYNNIYIVKVVSAEKIEGTHLTLCKVDAGTHTADFSDSETVQVVCGAPNVHAGMLAVWLAPGAIVPQTYGNENFKLGKRKLQGFESNGMLAAIDELDLGTDHEGIAEIDPRDASAGDSFAEVFELNDLIIDVENKSLTHRPDCFGLIGFAREIAGILGKNFNEPEWPELKRAKSLPVSIEIADSELCPRYSCAVFELPNNQPSKFLTKEAVFLAKSGMRSIDPMVDLTNSVMLRTGQPLHAFDYDKFVTVGRTENAQIIVRVAKRGESLQLLDGKIIECTSDDILITSNNVPVALAGAMGGKNTEIDASTKRVILESATFSLYHLRKTQMAHGIFSEAITRFTKGQPAAMTLPVLSHAVCELEVEPLALVDKWVADEKETVVKITTQEVNNLLGTKYSTSKIIETLEHVGFNIVSKAFKAGNLLSVELTSSKFNSMIVTVPEWRTDIHIKEDIIEEVGRLLGFDNIPLNLPTRPFRGAEIAPMWKLKQELRQILSDDLAMNELLTYSFVHRDLIVKVGQDPEDCYQIVNSISPDLQYFRSEIAPSLLDKVRENLKAGHKDFTLYEMNQVSRKSYGLTDEHTPVLKNHLGIVSLGDFYQLKAKLLAMFKALNIPVEYTALSKEKAAHQPDLEPKRSAELIVDGHCVGAFGEVKASVLRQFKFDCTVSACEINLDQVSQAPRKLTTDFKTSKFPFVERDLTLKVNRDAAFGRFYDAIDDRLRANGLIFEVRPLSIYQADPESPTKNISFRLKFSNPEKTLDQADISAIIDKINVAVVSLGAEIV